MGCFATLYQQAVILRSEVQERFKVTIISFGIIVKRLHCEQEKFPEGIIRKHDDMESC